jgi:hypothetical protein
VPVCGDLPLETGAMRTELTEYILEFAVCGEVISLCWKKALPRIETMSSKANAFC